MSVSIDLLRAATQGRATAVHIAAMQQRRQVLFHLLLSGADPDLVDDVSACKKERKEVDEN